VTGPERTGRRARLRAQTTADIVRAAGEQLAAEGASGLSLRAIARTLDMGVSSLYRYFPSRDELLTELLVRTFDDQADAVQTAAAATDRPTEAIRAVVHAYREWSLAHPVEFGLAYGSPVPGYHAPSDRTVRAGTRVGDLLVRLVEEARSAGQVDEGPATRRDGLLAAGERQDLESLIARRGYRVSVGLMSLIADSFVRVHGFVAMEVFGQLRPLFGDATAAYQRTVDGALASIGLAESSGRGSGSSDHRRSTSH